jgi:hypothetical protein
MFDPASIANELAVSAIGAAVFWVVTTTRKLRKDINQAFRKIRDLEGKK